jgi:CHAT domain-containing protein
MPICLVERFDVVMAPSALAREVCRRRAAQRETTAPLLAVGNPLPQSQPLEWATAEAEMVADLVGANDTVLLTGAAATASAVAAALPGAAFAHFACHGSAAVSPQALDSALYFADDEPLTGADLMALGPLAARLVVASACETGINPGYETADEALSLSTVLLGAGAAGAIASLWAVDDLATALLMCKFYEVLAGGAPPETALRVAMLWLRDLEPPEAVIYARERRSLRSYRDRTAALERATRERGEARPFSAPSSWAAFVLSGA